MTEHWERIYSASAAADLEWHEPVPATLPMVLRCGDPTDSVIDVGGGASTLARHLLDRGYDDVTVADVSGRALDLARTALGGRGERVHWLHADVVVMEPERQWSVWHDRHIFHFLVDASQRADYSRAVMAAVGEGGHIIVSTFASEGPERSAGLPVARYTVEQLAAEFSAGFELVEAEASIPLVDAKRRRFPYVAVRMRRR